MTRWQTMRRLGLAYKPSPDEEVCSACDGLGYEEFAGRELTCELCGGSGWIEEARFTRAVPVAGLGLAFVDEEDE